MSGQAASEDKDEEEEADKQQRQVWRQVRRR